MMKVFLFQRVELTHGVTQRRGDTVAIIAADIESAKRDASNHSNFIRLTESDWSRVQVGDATKYTSSEIQVHPLSSLVIPRGW